MVTNTWWQSPDARQRLREQVSIWYSLVVADLDPETLLRPYAVLRSWRSLSKAIRILLAETIVGIVGIALIAVFGVLVATASKQAAVEAVLAALGIVGITGATVQARIKAKTQAAVARLGRDLSTDLVASQIAVSPTRPAGMWKLWQASETRRMMGRRVVTAPLQAGR